MTIQNNTTPRNSGRRPAAKTDGAISDADIDTRKKTGGDDVPRQPHERDESPDNHQANAPRDDMRQAARDLRQGQVDTDMRGMRGAETVDPASAATSDAAKTGTAKSDGGKRLTPPEKSRGDH